MLFRLHILPIYDPWSKMKDGAIVLFEYDRSSHAELRALRWLMYRPNDIVALEEVETRW